MQQSRVHSSPSHPSDKGFDDFPDTSTTDLSNFPTLLSSPPSPSLHHSFRFPSPPCHPAAAPGHSSSVLFSPPRPKQSPDADFKGIFMWFGGESHAAASFLASKRWDAIQLRFRSSAALNWFNPSVRYPAGNGLCLPGRWVRLVS